MLKINIKSLLLVALLVAGSLNAVHIERTNLFVPSKIGKIKVYHDEDGFSVKKEGQIHRVQNCFVDKEIRNLSSKQLMQFLGKIKIVEIDGQKVEFERITEKQFKTIAKAESSEKIDLDVKESEQLFSELNSSSSGYISVNQMSDGEYCLRANIRVSGGGGVGAVTGFWLGKAATHGALQVVAWGVGGLVGIFCPPAGLIVTGTIIGTLAVPVEAASNIVGLAAGIALGAATGPV